MQQLMYPSIIVVDSLYMPKPHLQHVVQEHVQSQKTVEFLRTEPFKVRARRIHIRAPGYLEGLNLSIHRQRRPRHYSW